MMLFWRHGFEGVSVAYLTEALGVAPASLYAAFGSKADLYKEALELYLRRVKVQATYTLETDRPIRETVGELLKSAVLSVTDDEAGIRGCMISVSMLFHAPDKAALAEHVEQLRRDWQTRIASRLQRATDVGELPASPGADAWACYLVSLMQGMGIQARDGTSRDALMVVARLGFTTMFGPPGAFDQFV
ncbi:TetR/AcrR family transcriptional regulator [Acetobacter nitrogenifigens]|nr:TetR/AcrR family transcriptional regulator [Acetobacter nitrogenifigens]